MDKVERREEKRCIANYVFYANIYCLSAAKYFLNNQNMTRFKSFDSLPTLLVFTENINYANSPFLYG